MNRKLFYHKKLNLDDEVKSARSLAERLDAFAPECVAYLGCGGERVGQIVAERFDIPIVQIDIGYPFSPFWNRTPRSFRFLLWPIKEILYRLNGPSLRSEPHGLQRARRLALVDDSASTGRSIALAISVLAKLGLHRHEISVGVIRCGERARRHVDHYLIREPVLFTGR